ncbi:MAG: response regulator [Treponema sp.]|jgi:signal transduction histidine kinase|nr:response regulator [Treponema sp.]
MSTEGDGKTKTNNSGKPVHLRIFIVIIATAVIITAFALAAGGWFLTRSTIRSIEESMLVAVDLADQYVSKEIEVLKIRAAEAAKDIRLLYSAGVHEGALERIGEEYFRYIGLAVFDDKNLLDSWGVSVVPPSLINEPFMRIAMNGGQAVSSTMYLPDGTLVMYVSAPIGEGLILAAVLPGLHFSGLISQFKFWQSGHLFIDDKEGTIISNIRQQWVEDRINFIDLANTDSSYAGVAQMVIIGQTGERGVAQFSLNGVPRICAYRPVSSPTENWFLGLIAPIPESPLKDIPGGILLMGMITLILSIAAAIAAAIILRRPYLQVDQLRKEAEIASVTKSTFLANMSHEIRTPMNSIMGFSELALDGETSPKTRDYLQKIKTNAEWLLQIINDILDISKVESGKMELEKIPFDMHELLSGCRTLILPKAVEKGIILHFYAEPSVNKKPVGDPTRLRQVFINLLSNSVKFTNTGMIKLQAVLKSISDTSITMHFEIKDSGIGMTPEQVSKIFEPFIQAESGTTRKYGGTGLGLTITNNIVKLMGGELLVDSMPGVGTKFCFDLTFDAIDYSSDKNSEQTLMLDEIEKPFFNGEILLCEDNTMNQEVICDHLARVGLKTIVADNGKIGVDMVKRRMNYGEKQFDLIFMDIHMPVMDGLEASAKIIELKTGIPVIAMTANIMSGDWDIYKKSGMNDCVGKPFTSQELWRCLLKYLRPVEENVSESPRE